LYENTGVGEDVALEAGGVVEQVTGRDDRGGRLVGDAELGEVGADRHVEVDQSLVDQLHHQRARPELGDRPDLEHRVGRGFDARGQVQQAGGAVDHLTVEQHGPRGSRHGVLA
jgi:hypothetical protein